MRIMLWEDDSNLRTEDGTGPREMFEPVWIPGRRRGGRSSGVETGSNFRD